MDQKTLHIGSTPKRAINGRGAVVRIYVYLLSVGVLASCTVLGVLWWLTARIDTEEAVNVRDQIQLHLHEKFKAIQAIVEDYGYWTTAWEHVTTGNHEGVHGDLGSAAADSFILNYIYILDSDQTLLYAYGPEGQCEGQDCYNPKLYDGLIKNLIQTDPYEYQSFTGSVGNENFTGSATAVWITPDEFTDEQAKNLPILIGVHSFSTNSLSFLEQHVSNLSVDNDLPQGDKDFLPLEGPNGAVGWLSWVPNRSGTEVRNEVVGWVGAICVLIVTFTILVSRHFGQLAHQLSLMSQLASTDALTGLLNRAGLEALQQKRDVKSALKSGEISVLVVDLNKFKELNDQHGHLAGDAGLKAIAEQFTRFVRRDDWVVRLGGDEFVAIFMGAGAGEAAQHVGKRLLSASEDPISFGDIEFFLKSSVGIASGEPGVQLSTLIERADAAMYWAKRNQASMPVKFDSSMKIGAIRS